MLTELSGDIIKVLAIAELGDPVTKEPFCPGEEPYTFYPNARVDETTARAYLPAGQGFTYTDSRYNEAYIGDLEYTKKLITSLLFEPRFDRADFYYHASW